MQGRVRVRIHTRVNRVEEAGFVGANIRGGIITDHGLWTGRGSARDIEIVTDPCPFSPDPGPCFRSPRPMQRDPGTAKRSGLPRVALPASSALALQLRAGLIPVANMDGQRQCSGQRMRPAMAIAPAAWKGVPSPPRLPGTGTPHNSRYHQQLPRVVHTLRYIVAVAAGDATCARVWVHLHPKQLWTPQTATTNWTAPSLVTTLASPAVT